MTRSVARTVTRSGVLLSALAAATALIAAPLTSAPARAAVTEASACGASNVPASSADYSRAADGNLDLVSCEDPSTLARPVRIAAGCSTDAAATLLFGRINEFRAENGLAPLVRTCTIEYVAQTWSDGMARSAAMSHNPQYAVLMPTGWSAAGENVAWTTLGAGNAQTADRLFTLWLNSAPHRAAMLSSTFSRAGVGVAYGNGAAWATLDLARY